MGTRPPILLLVGLAVPALLAWLVLPGGGAGQASFGVPAARNSEAFARSGAPRTRFPQVSLS